TGALHTVPWPVLPGLRARPVCIAPSAAAWLAAANAPAPAARTGVGTRTARAGGSAAAARVPVVAVAGPGLAHAEAEVSMVLGTHRGAVRVAARTEAVLEALRAADVAHLAAHGVFCAH